MDGKPTINDRVAVLRGGERLKTYRVTLRRANGTRECVTLLATDAEWAGECARDFLTYKATEPTAIVVRVWEIRGYFCGDLAIS